MANRLLLAVASSAMFLFVAPAAAAPIVLNPNPIATIFNFDATGLMPYSAVSFFVQAVDTDTPPDYMFIGGERDVGFTFAFSCDTGFSTTLTECDSFMAGSLTNSVFLDGIFSLEIWNLGFSNFSVDPYVMIGLSSGALVRLDPVSITHGNPAAPEPGSLALLGIGLAGLGFSRRKQ
jgi:hypothetical protein